MSWTAPARALVTAVATAALTVGAAPAAVPAAPGPTAEIAEKASWKLAFQDHFGTKAKSNAKWFNSAPRPLKTWRCWKFGTSSGQKVAFVRPRKPWEDGHLSCRMRTHQTFADAPHRFSARVKFHAATGTLSSFWVTGEGPNEIDVFENTGKKDGRGRCVLKRDRGSISRDDESARRMHGLMQNVYHAYEPSVGHRNCVKRGVAHPRYDGRFHVVSAVWNPGRSVTFSLDGQRVARFGKKWSRTSPVFALLTNKTASPSGKPTFVVDWVKVWRKG